ncbi:hypothetical protein J4407_00160 [Candidatus Pacearchaeota archaeon]|nr:hypothetical protein [Candidatus Pacearchaeota archaeon]
MNFIKKIFDDQIDDEVHSQFQKFSRGEFKNRAIVEVKNSNGKYSIKTSAEFANELVKTIAEKLGDKKTLVTGAIVSTMNIENDIEFKDKKQFQGVKRYLIENEVSGKDILKLMEKYPKAFFALSFSAEDTELKIKPKAAKSAKPSVKEEAPKADFCSIKTSDRKIAESFVFDSQSFKSAMISHDFIINEIVIPNELKKEKDFSKIREIAKRKGKIIRHLKIDGKEMRKEKGFEA